jgi:hypothetical protein
MGTSFTCMEINMTSHPDLDADQLVELLLAASENGFVTLGDEPGPYSFDCDGDCVHASWDDFFVKYASFLAPGSEFCVMTSDDVLYGYRIDADRKVTFVEGEIVWKELTTVSVSRPLEEIRAACIGRTNPVILNAYRRDVRSTAPNLVAAIDANRGEWGVTIDIADGSWVLSLHGGNDATLTLPRDLLGPGGALPEGRVDAPSDESLRSGLGGGDAEAREGLDSGEDSATQE